MALDPNLRLARSDSGIVKRSISDVIFMLGWEQIPELTLFGMNSVGKFNIENWPTTQVEFIEDKMRPFTSLLDTALADGVGTTVSVTTGEGVYFRAGNVIKINDEAMFVESVSGDDLTVTRGYGSTSGTTHAQYDPILIATFAAEEGADYATGHVTNTSQWMNYTQILSETVKVSKTRAETLNWGINDELDYQTEKLFADGGQAGYLARLLAQQFYHGEKQVRDDNNVGTTGGFNSRLGEIPTAQNVDMAGGAMTEDAIADVIEGIRQNNGMPDILLTNALGMRSIAKLYKDTIRTTRDETIGGHEINQIVTPLGNVSVVYSWLCPADHMYFVDRNKVGWFPLRPFTRSATTELGDRYGAEVVGEYTFGMVNPEGHGRISNFIAPT